MKRRRVIPDYVLIGAIGATAYMEPVATEDLDIIVDAETDEEFMRVFRNVGGCAEGQQGMHHMLGGIPVQIFPSGTKPLYRDTLERARSIRLGNLRVKVASTEHLIVLGVEAFRQKDQRRIQHLLQAADRTKLKALLGNFDDEQNTLTRRLEKII